MEEIDLGIEPPFGVSPGQSFRLQEFPLRPGDRIVFLTDGMLERNATYHGTAPAWGRTMGAADAGTSEVPS